jgi:hypothetical protein
MNRPGDRYARTTATLQQPPVGSCRWLSWRVPQRPKMSS